MIPNNRYYLIPITWQLIVVGPQSCTGLSFAVLLKKNMPEGPSLVILKEATTHFIGKKILEVSGNSKIDKHLLVGQKVIDLKTWGKHFIIITKPMSLRIHFLLFGTYSLDEQTKPDKSVRLSLRFKKGAIYFYTCAIKVLEADPDEIYDWSSDVMNEAWNPAAAKKKLKALPELQVCDALLDQNIFAGVGNIIKNEVLYRIKLHPETRMADIPQPKLNELIKEARNYSFEFLVWKKAFVLKKHWLAHTKKTCKRCELSFTKKYCGKTMRRTFYCENCQIKYANGKAQPLLQPLPPVQKKAVISQKTVRKRLALKR